MSKEAMKLALEALELCNGAQTAEGVVVYTDKEITALREALAEQPAQTATYTCGVCGVSMQMEQPAQQEQYIGETNVELGFYSDDASNGQQRELVGKVEMGQLVGNRPHESTSNSDTEREIAVITGVDEHGPMLGWFKHWINYPVGTKLYTSPPAQRTWVGLTDEQFQAIKDSLFRQEGWDGEGWDLALKEAIEAKLKEKNNG